VSHRRGVDRLLDWDAGRVVVVHGLRGDSHTLYVGNYTARCVILGSATVKISIRPRISGTPFCLRVARRCFWINGGRIFFFLLV
jgi:hypothetical protein